MWLFGLSLAVAAAAACAGRKGPGPGDSIDAAVDAPYGVGAPPDTKPATDLSPADVSVSTCGNTRIDPGEECDDGNTVPNDGCGRTCQIEEDWPPLCPQPPCLFIACGDGVRHSSEACDDGNTTPGDGCSRDCHAVEEGWRCPIPGRDCFPICGDRLLSGTEDCDDGNAVSGDGCSNTCLTEPGWDCSSGVCEPLPPVDGGLTGDGGFLFCGDGIRSGAEECDEGDENNDLRYGGCSTRCQILSCGDGMLNGSEECDLGPHNTGATYGKAAGCTTACRRTHYCGDGIVDSAFGETCDLGPANDTPGGLCQECALSLDR